MTAEAAGPALDAAEFEALYERLRQAPRSCSPRYTYCVMSPMVKPWSWMCR